MARRLRPPLLGRTLLRLRRLGERREEIETDLDELFRERAVERGRWYAAVRYCADALSLWVHDAAGVVRAAAPQAGRVRGDSSEGGSDDVVIDPRRRNPLDAPLTDVKFALRSLLRRPGFAASAVLTLALGIGANAAMFSIIERVVLAPLPFVAPDRVVQVWDLVPVQERGVEAPMRTRNFRDYENLNEVFSH